MVRVKRQLKLLPFYMYFHKKNGIGKEYEKNGFSKETKIYEMK